MFEVMTTASITPYVFSWWRHQMETFSALLAICAGNSPVPGEFPTQRPVTRSFDVYFDLRPNKWLSKQSWGWWFETLSCSLWRHRNGVFAEGVSHAAQFGPRLDSVSTFRFPFGSTFISVRLLPGMYLVAKPGNVDYSRYTLRVNTLGYGQNGSHYAKDISRSLNKYGIISIHWCFFSWGWKCQQVSIRLGNRPSPSWRKVNI